jgi:hypothetical protein
VGWHAVASTAEGYSDAALGVKGVDIEHVHPNGNAQFLDAGDSMNSKLPFRYYKLSPLHQWP